MTGSTPAQWDTGGPFNSQLNTIKDTHVVMTLGANPILSSMLQIKLALVPVTNGLVWIPLSGWGGRVGGTRSRTSWTARPAVGAEPADTAPRERVQDAAEEQQQGPRSELPPHRAVVVRQLAAGGQSLPKARRPETLPSQKQKVSECSNCPVKGSTTQYAQAMAVQDAMNAKIAAAVGEVQQWAKTQPGIDPADLQLAIPNQSAWEQHQAWSNDPWVFKNDTWIHPSKAGHAQLVNTVTTAMCSAFGQWCGDQPAWDPTPPWPPPSSRRRSRGRSRSG